MPSLYLYFKNLYSIKILFLLSSYKNKISFKNVSLFDANILYFNNPLDMSEILSIIIDNNDKFKISVWMNLDRNFFLKVSDKNLNYIIKYLFERYPY